MPKILTAPVAALVLLAGAGAANAGVTLFADGFDSYAPGLAITTGLGSNWTVDGNIDLVTMPNGFGITCAGGCVDLDGSGGPGGIRSVDIAFAAGRAVTITYDLSGSQRATADDPFAFFVNFASPIAATGLVFDQPGGAGGPGGSPALSGLSFLANVPGSWPWGRYSLSFTPGSAGSLQLTFYTDSADNVGPLVDTVLVTQASGIIPEPATWALLVAGFGLVGGTMRRRLPVAGA